MRNARQKDQAIFMFLHEDIGHLVELRSNTTQFLFACLGGPNVSLAAGKTFHRIANRKNRA